jgi:hypothetical protein
MIKLVLSNPVQQMIEVVPFPRNSIPQSGIWQCGDGLSQFVVNPLRFGDSLAPRGLTHFDNRWKIVVPSRLIFLARKSYQTRTVPDRDVQYQFPDAVNILNRPRRSGSRIDIGKDFK